LEAGAVFADGLNDRLNAAAFAVVTGAEHFFE
jgi:hypothetical protein